MVGNEAIRWSSYHQWGNVFLFYLENEDSPSNGRYLSIPFLSFSLSSFFLLLLFFAMSLYVMDDTYGSFIFSPPDLCVIFRSEGYRKRDVGYSIRSCFPSPLITVSYTSIYSI